MRQTHVVQVYESYLDYSDYPEGWQRTRLIEAYQTSREHAQSLANARITQVGTYTYYRIYK